MDTSASPAPADPSAEEEAVHTLYRALLRAWNERDANAFAALFLEDGSMIGYDGTVVDGQPEIVSHLSAIFAHHQTPTYVHKVKRVCFHTAEMATVRGAVGMPTLPEARINPVLNSIQSLVVLKRDGVWRIALFQNTPAQFHGRPELVAQMTEELQRALDGTI